MNIAFFSVGSAIKFNPPKYKRSDGSAEYTQMLHLLLKNKNINKIVIWSPSNWSRLKEQERQEIDPENKLYDPWKELSTLRKLTGKEPDPDYMLIRSKCLQEEVPYQCSFGIGFFTQGFSNSSNLTGWTRRLDDTSVPIKSLAMTRNYSSHIIFTLNSTNMPWFLISTDPRYMRPRITIRDVTNLPQEILGQIDMDVTWRRNKKFEPVSEQMESQIKCSYSMVERANIMNKLIISPDEHKKDIPFLIVAMDLKMGHTPEQDLRFRELKRWILDKDENQTAQIYGTWREDFIDGYPQFKGFLDADEIDKKLLRTRYSLVLPAAEGWVTSKYAELLQLGVIPFLHPQYDTQYHVVDKDHFIRVKSPDDFYKKMKYLDKNPEKRNALVKGLQKKLLYGFDTGERMLESLNHFLEKNGIQERFDTSQESRFSNINRITFSSQKPKVKSLF